MVNHSTQNPPAQNTPPEQTFTPLLPPIGNLFPISEIVKPQTENTLTSPNPPEHNNPPVVMDTPHLL